MPDIEITTNEIMDFLKENMDFLKENMVTKEELDLKLANFATKDDLLQFATKDDLERLYEKIHVEFTEFRSDILTTADQFVKKHDTLETEQYAMRGRFERLEDRVETVEERAGLAAT